MCFVTRILTTHRCVFLKKKKDLKEMNNLSRHDRELLRYANNTKWSTMIGSNVKHFKEPHSSTMRIDGSVGYAFSEILVPHQFTQFEIKDCRNEK